MKTTVPERVELMKNELKIKEDVEFARLAGASKAMVNHWLTGRVKSIAAKYAYRLEEKTGFSAKWIQLGEGSQRHSMAIIHTATVMQAMSPEQQYLVARLVDQVAEPADKDKANTQ